MPKKPQKKEPSWKIFIPTFGRVDDQVTLENIPRELFEKVVFVCNSKEAKSLSKIRDVEVLIEDRKGVAVARQTIIEKGVENCIMFDDDLSFFRRSDDWVFGENTKLERLDDEDEFTEAIEWLVDSCNKEFPMVGFGPRAHNNSIKERDFIKNTRMMRSLCVHAPTVLENNIRFDRFYYWEDFHVALSLLELGYENKLSVEYVTDAKPLKSSGGVVRIRKKMESVLEEFEKEHPTIRGRTKMIGEKEYPDMTVYWKKALK